jgi:hypothetical protein
MKSIDIKGKPYVMVNERIKFFRDNFDGYSLLTEIIDLTDERVVMKATILDQNNEPLATGHAYEDKDSTFINKTSYIENAETSAWGRALANFGIGIEESVASFDEVANDVAQKNDKPWLNDKKFNNTVDLMNREPEKEKRMKLYKDLYKDYRVAKRYERQFLEIVEQRDINV